MVLNDQAIQCMKYATADVSKSCRFSLLIVFLYYFNVQGKFRCLKQLTASVKQIQIKDAKDKNFEMYNIMSALN